MRVTVLFIYLAYLILYLRHPRHQRKARATDRRVPRVIGGGLLALPELPRCRMAEPVGGSRSLDDIGEVS